MDENKTTVYGIIPPGLAVNIKNLLKQDDRFVLFPSVTAATTYLDTQSVINKTYFKIIEVSLKTEIIV